MHFVVPFLQVHTYKLHFLLKTNQTKDIYIKYILHLTNKAYVCNVPNPKYGSWKIAVPENPEK